LPGDHGYAEILSETLRGQGDPIMVVYFLKPDAKSALSPLPTNVRVKASDTEVTLSAAAGPAKDPAGAGRMVSGPLPADPDRVSGELIATVGGQPFQTPFNLGQ
jgi:hypothetical protein